MPGIVIFRRRWGVGSDDLVVPGVFLFVLHFIWITVLIGVLAGAPPDKSVECGNYLWIHMMGYVCVLGACMLLEMWIAITAMKGGILDVEQRAAVKNLLYVRLGIMVVEVVWMVLGVVWLTHFYVECPMELAKDAMLGVLICNWIVLLSILLTVYCTFDAAGRSWVKMKKFQRSMREGESRFQYKRSGSHNRNWRHSCVDCHEDMVTHHEWKVIRAYQDSWDHRCRLLFCCMRKSDRNRNSFTDIARLLSDFFRDLDVVPSDVIAGLVLLRKFQKIEREAVINQRKNETYDYLSGVAVTSATRFLALHDPHHLQHFRDVIHYMNYALGAYGWPMFLMTHSGTGLCQLCAKLRCMCFPCVSSKDPAVIIDDNCCQCNYAALRRMVDDGDIEVVYATYHVDVGETPFFVAVDYDRQKIVISIRGTLSMKDVLTDLNAEGETLPLNPPRDDWCGHKGMVHAAEYIRDKLRTENVLERAYNICPERGTQDFGLVLVGHSLGAGTAAILAILLRQQHQDLKCFSYSPPGGLLSMPAVEYTKQFITSVVVGKDVVPRIGLHQMESLRADLINAIKRSKDPKWKTIMCSVVCCGCAPMPTSAVELSADDSTMQEYQKEKDVAREMAFHPSDSSIALTLHQPLYPPGRIIHIVRHHPTKGEQVLKKQEPVYQALWANNTDFDEVLISPVMIQDHMPDTVLEALKKVISSHEKHYKGPNTVQHQNNVETNKINVTSHCHDTRFSIFPVFRMNMLWRKNSNSLVLETRAPVARPLAEALLSQSSMSMMPLYRSMPTPPDSDCCPGPSPVPVITTIGPAKPQRASSTCAAAASPLTESCQAETEKSKLICRPKPLMSPHRVLLETSFTSLQAEPGGGTTTSLGSSTGIASSSTGGVRWSSGPPIAPLPAALSPGLSWEYGSNPTGSLQTVTRKVDLIHDDWLGLAPLATPESLSEVSSISSRTSSSRASSYDRGREYFSICGHSRLSSGSSQKLEDVVLVQGPGENAPTFPIILQSNDRTPRVLRRTPKINGNLSSAAEDLGSNLKYAMTNINLASFAVRRNLPIPMEDESKSTASEDEDGLSEPVRRKDLGVLSRQGSVNRSRVVTSPRDEGQIRDECSSNCDCLSASPCSSGGPSRRIAPEALPLLRNIGVADDNDSVSSFLSGSSKKYNCSVVAVSKGESSV